MNVLMYATCAAASKMAVFGETDVQFWALSSLYSQKKPSIQHVNNLENILDKTKETK